MSQSTLKQVHNTLTSELQSSSGTNSMSLLKKSQRPGIINKERTTMVQKRQAANRCDFSQLTPLSIDMKHHSSESSSPSASSSSTCLTSASNSSVSNSNCATTRAGGRLAAGTKKAQKPRRRVATVAQRRAANIRERRRMFNLNSAFDRLRKKVPSFAYEKRLSRIETLKLAIMYIRFMDNLVNDDAYAEKYKQLTANLSQQQQQQHPACPLGNNLLSSTGSYLSNGILYTSAGTHCVPASECTSPINNSLALQQPSTNNNSIHISTQKPFQPSTNQSPQQCSTPHSSAELSNHLEGGPASGSFSPISSSTAANSFYRAQHQFRNAPTSAASNSKTFPLLPSHLSSGGQLMHYCASPSSSKSLTISASRSSSSTLYNEAPSPAASPLNYQSTGFLPTHFYQQPTNLALHSVEDHYQSNNTLHQHHHHQVATAHSICSAHPVTYIDTPSNQPNYYQASELSTTNQSVQKHSMHMDNAASYSLHSLEAR